MTRRTLPRNAGSATAKVILTVLVLVLLYAAFFMINNGDPTPELPNPFSQDDPADKNGEADETNGDSSARPDAEKPSGTDSNRTDRETDPERIAEVREQLDKGGRTVGTRGEGGPRPPATGDSAASRNGEDETRSAEKAEPSPEEALRRELRSVRAELRDLGDAMLQTTRSLDARLDELERNRDGMNRTLERTNAALEAMERRVFEHRTTIARLERDIRQPGGRFDMGDPVALPPRRLYRNSPMKLFEGQVLIHLTGFHARSAGFPAANFEITLPLLDMIHLDDVGIGDRRIFHYAGREFFLEVLGTDGETWARVVVTRKLPE